MKSESARSLVTSQPSVAADPLQRASPGSSGQWSIRINDQWRVCFKFVKGDAYDVEIVDYH